MRSQINIAPGKITTPELLFSTAMHELMHALGFSAPDFARFYDNAKKATRAAGEVFVAANGKRRERRCGTAVQRSHSPPRVSFSAALISQCLASPRTSWCRPRS